MGASGTGGGGGKGCRTGGGGIGASGTGGGGTGANGSGPTGTGCAAAPADRSSHRANVTTASRMADSVCGAATPLGRRACSGVDGMDRSLEGGRKANMDRVIGLWHGRLGSNAGRAHQGRGIGPGRGPGTSGTGAGGASRTGAGTGTGGGRGAKGTQADRSSTDRESATVAASLRSRSGVLLGMKASVDRSSATWLPSASLLKRSRIVGALHVHHGSATLSRVKIDLGLAATFQLITPAPAASASRRGRRLRAAKLPRCLRAAASRAARSRGPGPCRAPIRCPQPG